MYLHVIRINMYSRFTLFMDKYGQNVFSLFIFRIMKSLTMRIGDVKRKGGKEIYIRLCRSRCRSKDDIKTDLNGMR
jgi:hypothetical protein